MPGGCSPANGFGQFVETRLFIMYPRAPARIMRELKSLPEYTERRPLNRREVQAESKIFRSRIAGKSSYPYRGIGNNMVPVRWFYKGRHVKELMTAGRVTVDGSYKQSTWSRTLSIPCAATSRSTRGRWETWNFRSSHQSKGTSRSRRPKDLCEGD